MRRLFLLPLIALSFSCTREVTEVRPPPEVEPDFLGPYSGVYLGLTSGEGNRASRTMVIHLGKNIVLSPFELVDGEPRLSMFASVAEVPEGGGVAPAETNVVLEASMGFWGDRSVRCDPTEDFSTADPATFFEDVVMPRLGGCRQSPTTCKAICYMPNLFDVKAGMLGECIGEGALCSYPITVAGRPGRDLIELLFDQNAVAPPPTYDRLDCTTEADGWQHCTPAGIDCPEGWPVCLPLTKVCDFDSHVAGVYQATLTLVAASTDDPEPRMTEGSVELAVAVANNIPAIILFWSDDTLGNRLLIARLDSATNEFVANDGDSPLDAGWVIRDGREPNIQIDGRLVEDLIAGVVNLSGTWTESRTHAGSMVAATYTLSASRQSGVAVGTGCQAMTSCEDQSLVCPLGNGTQIRGSTLQVRNTIGDDGCVVGLCERVLDQSSLCESLPSCGGLDLGGGIYEAYDLWLSPPTCEHSDCDEPESCVRFVCHDEATHGPATAANWYQVDGDCTGQSAVLRYEGQAGVKIDCESGGLACPNTAPSCMMGASQEIETALTPVMRDDGCVEWLCEQFFTPDQICSDVTPPTCAADEMLIPSIRPVDGDADCIELTCQPGCNNDNCGQCGMCGPFDFMGCGSSSIRVSEDCGGCVRVECGDGVCPYRPATCPFGKTHGGLATRLVPEWGIGECVQFVCEQYYGTDQVCVGAPTGCPSGETLVPNWQPSNSCVGYTCEPAAGGELDPTTCEQQVRVTQAGGGKLFLDCRAPVCEQYPVACAVDIPGLQESYNPYLDGNGCMGWGCDQYYDPASDICSGAPLPSTLACTGGEVPTLQQRSGDTCLEHVCAPSCMSTCVDCGGACADASFPDSCSGDQVIVINPECGDCIYAQCRDL